MLLTSQNTMESTHGFLNIFLLMLSFNMHSWLSFHSHVSILECWTTEQSWNKQPSCRWVESPPGGFYTELKLAGQQNYLKVRCKSWWNPVLNACYRERTQRGGIGHVPPPPPLEFFLNFALKLYEKCLKLRPKKSQPFERRHMPLLFLNPGFAPACYSCAYLLGEWKRGFTY